MQFHLRPFRRLQWQLSLSYTLVAAGALLVVELALIGALLVVLNTNTLPTLLVQAFREQFSANLRPFLDQPVPDVQGAAKFLSIYMQESQELADDSGNLQVWTSSESTENFILLNPSGRMLWTGMTIAGAEEQQPFNLSLVPGLEQVYPAALANAEDPEQLYARTGDLLTIATPVMSQDNQRVVGVMVMTLRMPSITNPDFIGQLLPTIGISVLLFTLAAGLVGSVFGYFTARRLTRRLGRVSQAAESWSSGDFSTFIRDSEGDELGELARRLNAMAEQLQNLMYTRQELAMLEERNRIARELHDSVKQDVFATSMQLGAARALLPEEDSPVGQRLAEAERLTKQAQGELNALIRELRPVALEAKGLARALRDLTADWSRQTGIHARFEGPSEADRPIQLPVQQEQALFRIAQEALSNAARHSGARSVRVCLTREPTSSKHNPAWVKLVVEDDGRGFNPTEPNQGMGLKSMRERVESLGGAFAVESTPGKGTKVCVKVEERTLGT